MLERQAGVEIVGAHSSGSLPASQACSNSRSLSRACSGCTVSYTCITCKAPCCSHWGFKHYLSYALCGVKSRDNVRFIMSRLACLIRGSYISIAKHAGWQYNAASM